MTTVTVYDPPMCCASGVCGPEVDPKLAQFSGDLEWLRGLGVEVQRLNLAQEPERFVANAAIKAILERSGGDDLPAIVVGDDLVTSGHYPSRDELVAMVGLNPASVSDSIEPADPAARGKEPNSSGCCSPQGATNKSSCCG